MTYILVRNASDKIFLEDHAVQTYCILFDVSVQITLSCSKPDESLFKARLHSAASVRYNLALRLQFLVLPSVVLELSQAFNFSMNNVNFSQIDMPIVENCPVPRVEVSKPLIKSLQKYPNISHHNTHMPIFNT